MRPFRKEKIASLVRQVVGDAIAHRLQDPRVSPLTTVTRVEITNDLTVAKVFLSVQSDATAEMRSLAAVRHAAAYIQRMVAGALSMRHCPEVRFEIDEVAKGVRRTMDLLAENRRLEPELYETEDVDEQVGPTDMHQADGLDDGPSPFPGARE